MVTLKYLFFFNQAYPKIELKISTKYSNHEDSKSRKSGLDANGTSDIHHRLITLMSEQQPYLEKELTLFSLADFLKRTAQSQVINSVEGKIFFDYINGHRIALAK